MSKQTGPEMTSPTQIHSLFTYNDQQLRIIIGEFFGNPDRKQLKHAQRAAVINLYKQLNIDGKFPDTWSKDPNGKPHFHHHPWQLSISHSDRYVALVVASHGPLGIDLQTHGRRHQSRLSRYLNWPESQFFHRWCLYEAAYKAGLTGSRSLLELVADAELSPQPFSFLNATGHCWSPAPGLSAALITATDLSTPALCTSLITS
ncbi:4'-phosphopantetheinyl transferase family protein [Ferrimonas sediminum]|nr:hypothetical protein [Ferrimonas sediminum]